MFKALEEQSEELQLDGYGINITSMEEVFMKVGAEDVSAETRTVGLNDPEGLLKFANSYSSRMILNSR